MTPDFTARIEALADGTAILELAGELDISSAPLVTAQFKALVQQGLTNVVVDATNVSFMDSSGLRALLDGEKLVHVVGSGVYIVSSDQVHHLLELTSSRPLFSGEFRTVEDAVAAMEIERE